MLRSEPTVRMTTMKPVLKWVGGKTQILDDVLTLFPTQIRNYYEPFVGGGSVLLGFLTRVKSGAITLSGRVYVSDLNQNLINLYQQIQTSPEPLLTELQRLTAEFASATGTTVNRKPTTQEEALTSQESYYYWIRAKFNALSDTGRASPLAAAMMLFLNKTCFRGVYREGPHGFNVPFGHYKNPAVFEEAHIRAMSALIQGVEFSVCSFDAPLSRPGAGDFVYLDPPYAPETATSFVSYTSDGFNAAQHAALFESCKGLHARGAKFLMSNADVSMVKEAFPAPAYTTTVLVCRRAIHSKKPGSVTNEVLIRN